RVLARRHDLRRQRRQHELQRRPRVRVAPFVRESALRDALLRQQSRARTELLVFSVDLRRCGAAAVRRRLRLPELRVRAARRGPGVWGGATAMAAWVAAASAAALAASAAALAGWAAEAARRAWCSRATASTASTARCLAISSAILRSTAPRGSSTWATAAVRA